MHDNDYLIYTVLYLYISVTIPYTNIMTLVGYFSNLQAYFRSVSIEMPIILLKCTVYTLLWLIVLLELLF